MIQGPLSDIILEDWHAILQGSYRGEEALKCLQEENPKQWGIALWHIKQELEESDTQMALHHTDKMAALIVEVAGHPDYIAVDSEGSIEMLSSIATSSDIKDSKAKETARDYLGKRIGPRFVDNTAFRALWKKVKDVDIDYKVKRLTVTALSSAQHINGPSDPDRLLFWRSLAWANIRANDFGDSIEDKTALVQLIADQYRDYGLKLLHEGGHGAVEILTKETAYHFCRAKTCEARFRGRDPISNARAACWRMLAKAEIDALRIFKDESARLNMTRRDIPKGPTGTSVAKNDSLK